MPTATELLVLLANPVADAAELQEALENCGPALSTEQSAVAAYLSDGNADQAYWAATLIGRDADLAATQQDLLTKLACSDDRSLAARQRAAWALGRSASLSDSNRLQLRAVDAADDPRLARLIAAALQRGAG